MIPHSDRLLLVDGKLLAYRSSHNYKDLVAEDGSDVSFLRGFLDALAHVRKLCSASKVCVVWDGEPSRRRSLYAGYKAQRSGGMDMENRISQSGLREELPKLGISQAFSPTEEADDIIAALAKRHSGRVFIYSSDRDFCALVDDQKVNLIIPGKAHVGDERVYGEDEVEQEFGVPPSSMVLYKSFFGDKSDNIPGLKSFRKAGLLPAISRSASVDEVYENVDVQVLSKAEKQKLEAFRDNAIFNTSLVSLFDSVEGFETVEAAFDREAVTQLALKARCANVDEVLQSFTPSKGFLKTS